MKTQKETVRKRLVGSSDEVLLEGAKYRPDLLEQQRFIFDNKGSKAYPVHGLRNPTSYCYCRTIPLNLLRGPIKIGQN